MILGLAPMDGFTDCVYRALTQIIFDKYTKTPGHRLGLWTEFMNADGYLREPQRLIGHMIYCHTMQSPIAQIYGGNHQTLVQAAIDLETKYPNMQGIELNIGCPSPRIMECEAGAGMMKNKKRTMDIIKDLRNGLSGQFSIKTRLGLTQDDISAQEEFIIEASNYCDIISVHGRTFKQSHSGFVDRERMYKQKKNINPSCLYIGNGGLDSYQDCIDMCNNLDGVMVAQGAIANPWVLTPHIPEPTDRYRIIIAHLRLHAGYERYYKKHRNIGDNAIETYVFPMPTLQDLIHEESTIDTDNAQDLFTPIEYRKHMFGYLKTLVGSKELKQEIAQIKDYYQLQKTLHTYFASIGCTPISNDLSTLIGQL